MRTRLLALTVVACLLAVVGCQRVNIEKTVNVGMGLPQEVFSVDPPPLACQECHPR